MQLIGFCEIDKATKKGKLVIAIPLLPKADFYVVENIKSDKENSPDYVLFSNKIKYGALWKNKFEKDGETKNYFSGNIFTVTLPDNILKIVILICLFLGYVLIRFRFFLSTTILKISIL